jgi:hypothetical protein
MKVMLILKYMASIIFAMLFAIGLFLVMMNLSYSEPFEEVPGNLRDQCLAFGAWTLVGLDGTFLLRGFYREHITFFKLVAVIISLLAIITGIMSVSISCDSETISTLPFRIAGCVFGTVIGILGFICLCGVLVMILKGIISRPRK